MRPRPLPSLAALQDLLRELNVEGAPTDAPDESHLRALLSAATYLADRQKRIDFSDFSWADPAFLAIDDKTTFRVVYSRLMDGSPEGVRKFLLANLPRLEDGKALLFIDATQAGITEFQLTHALYGEVTLFSFPHKPSQSADLRIEEARENGWVKTLKEHNLMPGRGIVVLDEHHGLLLREPWLDPLLGVLAVYDGGDPALYWNPFARDGDSEMQYWLAWGRGGEASAWKEVLHVGEE